MVYSLPDPWTRQLFLALCRRYGLEPYRERGQRSTTVMVRAPDSFQKKTLWPEFQALSQELTTHLSELTARVIREAIHADVGEAKESDGAKALPPAREG
jgi:tRNA nucleotidyltransferase (CCA-adding enzyme)